MEFDHEFTLQQIFRPLLAFDGPPTVDLHIHWKLRRRVFYRTFQGILPPTADDAIDAFISSHFGFCLRPFTDFRAQVLMSITTDLDFPSALSHSASDQISSSVNDLLDERLIGLYPHLIVVAEINVVHNVYVNYDPIPLEIIPHLQIIQPRQLASSVDENTIPDTTTEDPEVDMPASMHDAFMRRPVERWGGDEEDIDDVFENFGQVMLSEDDENNNAGTEMLERIERRKWAMGEKGEVDCCICLDKFSEGQEVMTMACQHSYHEQCLLSWLNRNQTCPLCRLPV